MYLVLRKELRSYLDLQDAWPSEAALRFWLNKHTPKKPRSGFRARLKNGTPQSPRYVRALVASYMENEFKEVYEPYRQIFFKYLREQCELRAPETVTVDQAMKCVCEVPIDQAQKRRMRDVLVEGEEAIEEIFMDALRHPMLPVWGCRPGSADLAEAVEWLYVDVARRTSNPQAMPGDKDAEMAAEKHMGISMSEYVERAQEWVKVWPWAVVRGRGKRRPISMNIVLPVTEDAFRDVVHGRKASYDCGGSDILPRSKYFVVEGAMERPGISGGELQTARRLVFKSSFVQIAAGLPHKFNTDSAPIELVSFVGTPVAEARLKGHGFSPSGATMPKSGVRIMHRELPSKKVRLKDVLFLSTLAWLRNLIDGGPPLEPRSIS